MDDKAKELARQVDESKEGITPDQLKQLLEAETIVQPTQQPAVEPAPAPTPLAPADNPPTGEPSQGQPDVLDLIPEKFRAKDVPTSLANIAKSYSDLETELRKQKDETSNLNKLVQSFIDKETSQPVPVVGAQAKPADMDESEFFEKPLDSVRKVAAQTAAAQIIAYHTAIERQKYVDNFKASNPDFETYREDITAILRARPDLDRDEKNLPMVFELAKQRYRTRMDSMRKDLGLGSTIPSTPAPAPINEEAIKKAAYEQALATITKELERRRAASGIQGSSPATDPNARIQPRVVNQPLSPEDQILQDMLNSGPKKLTLLE